MNTLLRRENESCFFGTCLIALLSGCASNYQVQDKPYNFVLVTVSTENTIVTPPKFDSGNFVGSIKGNLLDLTTSNIIKNGNLRIAKTCAPGVLEIKSKIRCILSKDVYEVKRGTHTIERSLGNDFKIGTTGVFVDCATGREVGAFEHSEEGNNLFYSLQQISEDTATDAYKFVVSGG